MANQSDVLASIAAGLKQAMERKKPQEQVNRSSNRCKLTDVNSLIFSDIEI